MTCRKHQCPTSCDVLGNHLLSSMPYFGRYPSQSRMSEANPRSDPRGLLLVTLWESSCCWRQCLDGMQAHRRSVIQGNAANSVLQSQRVTDVVLRAFEACAASQGDCNNLTFGFGGNLSGEKDTKGFGYYETIAGGSGAVRQITR